MLFSSGDIHFGALQWVFTKIHTNRRTERPFFLVLSKSSGSANPLDLPLSIPLSTVGHYDHLAMRRYCLLNTAYREVCEEFKVGQSLQSIHICKRLHSGLSGNTGKQVTTLTLDIDLENIACAAVKQSTIKVIKHVHSKMN